MQRILKIVSMVQKLEAGHIDRKESRLKKKEKLRMKMKVRIIRGVVNLVK
jgi:hypothetical protein